MADQPKLERFGCEGDRVELRQLRYFVAVAEDLHFGRAAKRLRVSQPPLSRQVASLERELGATLLLRTRHQVELTPAGQTFLVSARDILASVQRAETTARNVTDQPSGRLRIGFVPAVGWPLASRALQSLVARYPLVEPVFHPSSSAEQIRAVGARQLDVGVVWEPARGRRADRLHRLVLRHDPIQVCAGLTHPFARRRRVTVGMMENELILLSHRRENPEAHDAILGAMKRLGFHGRVRYCEGTGIIDLVAAGVGVGFISAASPHASRPDIAVRSLVPPFLDFRLVMVSLPDSHLPALRGLLEVVSELQDSGQLF